MQSKESTSKNPRMLKKNEMEMWPEVSHKSGSGSPTSQNLKNIAYVYNYRKIRKE